GSAGGNEQQAGAQTGDFAVSSDGETLGSDQSDPSERAEHLLPQPGAVTERGAPGCAPAKRMLSTFRLRCWLPAFVVCGLVFQVHELRSAPLNVTGPPGPIAVAVGEDAVLPCRFSPAQGARDTEVTWFRENFSPFVHRYKGGQDQFGEQMLQYQGRTELLRNGLAQGSVDLKIFHVRLSDRGNYTCFVRHDSHYDEAVVELKVTASGSAPLIALERYQDGGIRVACHSAGWFPRPQLLWRDPGGR
ncbi:PREDICTED: butyrophilin subfamily 1 member A1-like, partial [Chlamydotis macqueenii]